MNEKTSKTHTDSAHLLRAVERGIVYDRLPAPIAVNMQPQYGYAQLRLATDDVPGVEAWAALTGAKVAHSTITHGRPHQPWHSFGSSETGEPGSLAGWRVNLWCSVDSPAPQLTVADAAPVVDEPEQPRDWHFTFGAGQEFDGRYVVVRGTFGEARATMNRAFGHAWCAQYETLPAECAGLTLLLPSEWPAHADDDLAAVDKAFLPTRDESSEDHGCPKCGRLHFPWCAPHGGPGYTRAAIDNDEQSGDGHVYSCCGKTGRISRHERWCPTNKSSADEQSGR